MLLYWYSILHFNHCTGYKRTTPHSTERRDHNADQQNLPVTTMPIDAFMPVRPQIIFFQQNYFDEICSTVTYVANAIYPVLSFLNLSVTVSTCHIFLDGVECFHNFINQELTFLQPSTVYEMTVSDDSLSTASDSTDASVTTVKENNPSQEVDSNS